MAIRSHNKYLPSNNAVKGDDVLKNDNFQIEKVTCSSQLGYKLKSQTSDLYLKIEKNDYDKTFAYKTPLSL